MRNWEEYKGIIFGMAFKFSPNHEEIEDWVGEGFICFMEVTKEEEKYGLAVPFEAALSNFIRERFLNLLSKRKAQKRSAEMISFADVEYSLGKDPRETLEKYFSLSKEMREVVDVILNAPSEFIDMIRHKNFKDGLSEYLRKHKGWTNQEIKSFWKEFKINK